MENGLGLNRIDTVSETPPAGRKICQMCDRLYNNKPLKSDTIDSLFLWDQIDNKGVM